MISSWDGYYDQADMRVEQQQQVEMDCDDASKPSRRHSVATFDDRCLPEFKLQYDESIYQELEEMEQKIQHAVLRQQKDDESK